MNREEVAAWSAAYSAAHPEVDAHERTQAALVAARQRMLDHPFSREVAQVWVDERRAILAEAPPRYGWCGCVGVAPNEPACRCRMKNVVPVGGRFLHVWQDDDGLHVDDLGSVP